MTGRPGGRRRPCTIADARARLQTAAELLGRVDAKLANTLARSLSRKSQAAYESRDITRRDAATCLRQATLLVEAAHQRVLGA